MNKCELFLPCEKVIKTEDLREKLYFHHNTQPLCVTVLPHLSGCFIWSASAVLQLPYLCLLACQPWRPVSLSACLPQFSWVWRGMSQADFLPTVVSKPTRTHVGVSHNGINKDWMVTPGELGPHSRGSVAPLSLSAYPLHCILIICRRVGGKQRQVRNRLKEEVSVKRKEGVRPMWGLILGKTWMQTVKGKRSHGLPPLTTWYSQTARLVSLSPQNKAGTFPCQK